MFIKMVRGKRGSNLRKETGKEVIIWQHQNRKEIKKDL